jgi:hypothetical protein
MSSPSDAVSCHLKWQVTTQDADGKIVSKLYSGWDIGHDVTVPDVAHFSIRNVDPHAGIFLFGCDTAATIDPENGEALSRGQESIAQAFANHFHTNVQGFNKHVGFGLPLLGWWPLMAYDKYHNGFKQVSPVSTSPN